jgi:hydroxymethylpyrimidine/phosphomethylpyrimidine kinase
VSARVGSAEAAGERPRILVLAGLDPSGGAGLLADAAAIGDGGGRALACTTAITVQTTRAVRRFEALPVSLVIEQATALLEEDGPVAAVKLGMLGAPEIAAAVARLAADPRLAGVPWVIDPVLRSSSGAGLGAAARAYEPLLPTGAIWTPNVPEAAALVGRPEPADEGELLALARELLARGPRAVIAKGGHLPGEPADLVVEAGGVTRLSGVRRPGTRRGTGCRFASALATALARGAPLVGAARTAKAYVAGYLDVG